MVVYHGGVSVQQEPLPREVAHTPVSTVLVKLCPGWAKFRKMFVIPMSLTGAVMLNTAFLEDSVTGTVTF